VLLAEALFDVDVFDVSPGAMYFTSLQRFFANPPPGLPCRTPRDYGSRLAGMIVKYEDERLLATTVLGAPVSVIPNGVPLPKATPSSSLAPLNPPAEHSTAPLVFGTAARIHPHKKLDDLLAAVRLAAPDLPPFRLRIAGGPDRGQEAYAADLRARNADLPIDWRGEVEETSASLTGPLAAFLATLDVFVLVAEPAGCPNASLEALAAGLPVIATNVGGMSEQIENGKSGRLVPRGDVPALARALIEIANNAALRRTFAQAGQTRIANHFSMDRMVTSYLRVCLPPIP
jgi:glycosyltransferase involved in cell wall biosynthesis